jgi:hypothetical protein
MAETVTMPKLGFDMAEGTLVRWVKRWAMKSSAGMFWLKLRRIRQR